MTSKKTSFKILCKIVMAIIVMAAIFISTQASVKARNLIDLDKKGTVRLSYQCDISEDGVDNPTPVAGVNVHLYRVASVDRAGIYTWSSQYSDIPGVTGTDINAISSSDKWNELLKYIRAYIYTNNISSDADAVSDSDGIAVIEDLELGIYLVVGDTLVDSSNNCTYSFLPFFTSVPALDEDTDMWVYDTGTEYLVDITSKCEYYLNPKDITYSLYKNWVDYDSTRPSSITVNIYCDGELYTTVLLSSSNSWHYSWTYKEGHTFTVSEVVPDGYTVSYNQSGNVFTMTNTGEETPPSSDTPGDSDTPDTPTTPGNPVSEVLGAVRLAITEDDTPEVLGATRLPQTGQLWWPVFVLALIGIGFFTVGFISEKRKSQH